MIPIDEPEVVTAACGFGYQGQCCCECFLLLRDQPSCDHTGSNCSDPCPEPNGKFVCLAFGYEGIALTDAQPHGCCECWTALDKGEREGLPLVSEGIEPGEEGSPC